MSTHVLNLKYTPDPCRQFASLITQPYGMVLTGGRHTLIAFNPIKTLQNDPNIFDSLINEPPLPTSHEPYSGGWYGVIGYDVHAAVNMMGLYDGVIVVDHEAMTCKAVFTEMTDDAESRRFRFFEGCERLLWPCGPRNDAQSYNLKGNLISNLDYPAYLERFNAIQQALQRGDVYQVNLTQAFTRGFEGSAFDYFMDLNAKHQGDFSAYLHLPHRQILSVSPERFIKIEGQHVETKPIKGTLPAHEDPETLQICPKNRAENLMIVDLMRNDLGRCCEPGSIQVPKLFEIESHPHVHHLVSTITGKLKDSCTPFECLQYCFPGGSITGAPKIAAMKTIASLEPHERDVYCGSIGYHNCAGRLDTNIAIRTAVIEDGLLTVYAGGGIVLDSDPTAEYQECLDKIQFWR